MYATGWIITAILFAAALVFSGIMCQVEKMYRESAERSVRYWRGKYRDLRENLDSLLDED